MLASLAILPLALQLPFVEHLTVDPPGLQTPGNGHYADVTPDGRFVVFQDSGQLILPDTNGTTDCYLYDRTTGVLELVSLANSGLTTIDGGERPRISDDGRHVVFQSRSPYLTSTVDQNSAFDVFVRDRLLQRTFLISGVPGVGTLGQSTNPDISGDGRYVTFEASGPALAPGGYFWGKDVVRHDRVTGVNDLISVAIGGLAPNGSSDSPRISADGSRVSFESGATNLVTGDANGLADLFVRDLVTNTTVLASVSTSGAQLSVQVSGSSISSGGDLVLFNALDLEPGDTNGIDDVYLRDLTLGVTERVSTDSLGGQLTNYSFAGSISADGRFVTFESGAPVVLLGGPTLPPVSNQVYVKDRTSDTTYLVSATPTGGYAPGYAGRAVLSDAGDVVAFEALAPGLAVTDTDGLSDVFVGTLPLANAQLLLTQAGPSAPLALQVDQATPGSQVVLAFTSGTQGPLVTPWGLAHLGAGATLVPLPTDATGAIQLSIPTTGLTGLVLAAQGLDVGSLELTTADMIQLQ